MLRVLVHMHDHDAILEEGSFCAGVAELLVGKMREVPMG